MLKLFTGKHGAFKNHAVCYFADSEPEQDLQQVQRLKPDQQGLWTGSKDKNVSKLGIQLLF